MKGSPEDLCKAGNAHPTAFLDTMNLEHPYHMRLKTMATKKTINLWINQRRITELLGVNRTTITDWQTKGLPFKRSTDSSNLYYIPAAIHFYIGYELFKRKIIKRKEAAYWIAVAHSSYEEPARTTIDLLRKAFPDMTEVDAALLTGEARAFWR